MYGHLLDGDLASNHLSWQWVAGTGSNKPYLFNAENVVKYAPKAWHSEGTIIDASYEDLNTLARSTPTLQYQLLEQATATSATSDLLALHISLKTPDLQVAGKDVLLIHPWSLGELPTNLSVNTQVIGVVDPIFHAAHPWSEQRWQWVLARMQMLCHSVVALKIDSLQAILSKASSVQYAQSPHAAWLDELVHPSTKLTELPKLFTDVDIYCKSFSAWWNKAKMRPI
jgi:deoxyribodipyrimidine photo-lyase